MRTITIDIENLEARMLKNGMANTLCQSDWLFAINKCEVKPVDCNKCFHLNEDIIKSYCDSCINKKGLRNRFTPNQNQNELDKLFIGAPVMMRNISGRWKLTKFRQSPINYQEHTIRLPTVEEAPCNVWLAPWLTKPEELCGDGIIIRLNDGKGICNPTPKECKDRWCEIEAVMILDELKR